MRVSNSTFEDFVVVKVERDKAPGSKNPVFREDKMETGSSNEKIYNQLDQMTMTTNSYIDNELVLSDLIGKIIRCATEVHKFLGNGFQEAVYRQALAIEFELRNVHFECEFVMPLYYKGEQIGTRQVDFFVDDKVMVEIKAIIQLEEVHLAQAVNYLEAYNKEAGLLINFGSKSLEFKRVMNKKIQSPS